MEGLLLLLLSFYLSLLIIITYYNKVLKKVLINYNYFNIFIIIIITVITIESSKNSHGNGKNLKIIIQQRNHVVFKKSEYYITISRNEKSIFPLKSYY